VDRVAREHVPAYASALAIAGRAKPCRRFDHRVAAWPSLQRRCILLAFCDMKTLYLRNVPDEVSARLASLAAREGLSLSSFAVRELTEASRRANNTALLGELADLDVSAEDVVADLQATRSAR
jgi:plasmid stability protein